MKQREYEEPEKDGEKMAPGKGFESASGGLTATTNMLLQILPPLPALQKPLSADSFRPARNMLMIDQFPWSRVAFRIQRGTV